MLKQVKTRRSELNRNKSKHKVDITVNFLSCVFFVFIKFDSVPQIFFRSDKFSGLSNQMSDTFYEILENLGWMHGWREG